MIWFTSDTHFGHKNIIKYSNRPFANADEMDSILIQRWNEKVAPNDEVYHLGDVALCSVSRLRNILSQLNGKIYLVAGNHETTALACSERFEWIKDYFELTINDEQSGKNENKGENLIILLHYAMRVWNGSHFGSFHLYGHSHGSLEDDINSRSFDVGVDCHNFYPISYQEVKEIMAKKQWKSAILPRNL
jgi:calcineurin-like phosphoesterase family protein